MILLLCGGSAFIVLREEIKENGLELESFKDLNYMQLKPSWQQGLSILQG